MQVIDTVISLLALLGLCAFLAAHCGLNSALAPLAAVSAAMLWFSVAGVLGVLVPAGWVFLALCFGLLAFACLRHRAAVLRALRTPGFLLFALLCLLALARLGTMQPLFSQWDEFSSWGTFTKLTHLSGRLFPETQAGWYWTSSEMPGMVVLGWFVQFLGVFAPWKCFFAYDILFFACFAAVLAPFGARRHYPVALGLGLCSLLLPFFFLVPLKNVTLTTAYMSSYNDLPAGVLFGGAVVCYLALRKAGRCPLWALLPLAALALVKENTLPITLVAAGLCVADTLFFARADRAEKHWPLRKGGTMAAFFAAPLAAYAMWKLYIGPIAAANPNTGGAATSMPAGEAVGHAAAQLAGAEPRSSRFLETLSALPAAFASGRAYPASMAGGGLATTCLILGIFLLAVLLAGGKRQRLRAGLLALLSAGGFVGFQFVLLTTYAFISKYTGGLPDYSRYSASYYAGWLLLALFVLACCAADGSPPRRALAARGAVLALACAGVALFCTRVSPGYSVLDYSKTLYAPLQAEQDHAEALAAHMSPGSRAFFVTSDDMGGKWFRYHYYLLPQVLDYSGDAEKGGGGSIGPPREEMHDFYVPFTPEELDAYLYDNGCDYILMETVNKRITKNYAHLFSDGLESWQGAPMLYRRGANGLFDPVA